MKVAAIEAFLIRLPFRFAFKHSLASRDESLNVIVRVVIENGARSFVGYGEGVPRDYVTGEEPQSAVSFINTQCAPRFLNCSFANAQHALIALRSEWSALGLDKKAKGASWCAFELAMLDALAKAEHTGVGALLSGKEIAQSDGIKYGAVLPFSGKKALKPILWFYKAFAFKTLKIKVGADHELDLHRLRIAREILGDKIILRVDANCAWTADEAIAAAEKMRQYRVASYEQPVAADDLDGLAAVTSAIPEAVVADESLCTVEDAGKLAANRLCSAFNIRISKIGGLLAARHVAEIGRRAKIACHMGAQVGESGILSAAGRCFALIEEPFDNYEGSNNFFLLKNDITKENLNVGYGGIGKPLSASYGLGVTINEETLSALKEQSPAAGVQHSKMHERIL